MVYKTIIIFICLTINQLSTWAKSILQNLWTTEGPGIPERCTHRSSCWHDRALACSVFVNDTVNCVHGQWFVEMFLNPFRLYNVLKSFEDIKNCREQFIQRKERYSETLPLHLKEVLLRLKTTCLCVLLQDSSLKPYANIQYWTCPLHCAAQQ